MKKVLPVKVKMSSQMTQDGETANFSFEEDGQLATVGNKHYLRYTEHQHGIETPVQFRLDDQQVHLLRSGDVETRFVFDETTDTTSRYQTAYGPIDLRVVTKRLAKQVNWDESRGSLEVEYDLHSAGMLVGSYHVSLQFYR